MRNTFKYFEPDHEHIIRKWGDFLKKEKTEGKLPEYEKERKLFLELHKLRTERKKFVEEIKKNYKSDNFENKQPTSELPKNFVNIYAELIKKDENLTPDLFIRECYELKQNNPKLGFRKLADKFHCGKDKISYWLKVGVEVKKKLDDWETRNKLLYQDRYEKEYEKLSRMIAKSKGVRNEDYKKWVVITDAFGEYDKEFGIA